MGVDAVKGNNKEERHETMKSRFTLEHPPAPSTTRRLALFSARAACWIAPVVGLVLAGVGLAHLFLEMGNYPEPRARSTVGLLLLLLFVPMTAVIWYLARRRVQALKAL